MHAPNPIPEIAIGTARYALDTSLAMVKREGSNADGRAVMFEANEPALAVVRTGELRDGERRLGPVYRAVPGGGIAVPTGRVFVRATDGTRVIQQTQALRGAGYVIADVPSWAPESAWLEAADGTVESALAGLPELTGVPSIAHVEPELLRPRERRADNR